MELKKIKHVVTLMLENHSFDNVLGSLYDPKIRKDFNGLTGSESNPNTKANTNGQPNPVYVKPMHGTSVNEMMSPDPDPGEEWFNMNEQIFGYGKNYTSSDKTPMPPAKMNGFVDNYLIQKAAKSHKGLEIKPVAQDIMNYFTSEQLPALHTLAKDFAVCDTWFASVPCQTNPNRMFLHTGQNSNIVNNDPLHKWFPFKGHTIFDLMQDKLGKKSRRIYFGDAPLTLVYKTLWGDFIEDNGTFKNFDYFKTDVANGDLAAYTHIEPKYLQGHKPSQMPDDMHPPHHVGLADQLVAEVYNTLRNSDMWESTLLIITFDEHGGIYDHAAPPAAVPPNPKSQAYDKSPNGETITFNYDRYGVRVPTIIISPYIEAGSILKPPKTSQYPYDHTSVIATIGACFDIEVSKLKSGRVDAAPTLANALTLDSPRQDCLKDVKGFRPLTPAEYKQINSIEPPNHLQVMLDDILAIVHLYKDRLTAAKGSTVQIEEDIKQRLAQLDQKTGSATRVENFDRITETLKSLLQ